MIIFSSVMGSFRKRRWNSALPVVDVTSLSELLGARQRLDLLIYASAATVAATSETATARPTVLYNFMGAPLLPARGNDGCASSRRMRRYREPFPVLLRPAIGVAPVRLLSVRRGVTERRMDDGEVAHDADLYIMRLQILHRHRLRGLLKEGGAVDQRFVGICGIELRRQDFIEAPNVGILHRGDEVVIERGEFVDVVGHCFS